MVRPRYTPARTSRAVPGRIDSILPTSWYGGPGVLNRRYETARRITRATAIEAITQWIPRVPRKGPRGPIRLPVLSPGGRKWTRPTDIRRPLSRSGWELSGSSDSQFQVAFLDSRFGAPFATLRPDRC